jgi:hypothetical protein
MNKRKRWFAAVLKAMLPIGAAHDLSIMYSQRKKQCPGTACTQRTRPS